MGENNSNLDDNSGRMSRLVRLEDGEVSSQQMRENNTGVKTAVVLSQVQQMSTKTHIQAEQEPVMVFLCCKFMKVGNIDAVNQRFYAELHVKARWLAPELEGKLPKDISLEKEWNPLIQFTNASQIYRQTHMNGIQESSEPDSVPYATLDIYICATFKGNFDLSSYPFDQQELTVEISSEWPVTDIKFVKDLQMKSLVNDKSFAGCQEWELFPFVKEEEHHVDGEKESAFAQLYPKFSFSCHVKRRVGCFIWSSVFITMFLMILALNTVGFTLYGSGSAADDRLNVSISLFLITVVFRLVVLKKQPSTSYYTLLDVYGTAGLILQCFMIGQIVFLRQIIQTGLIFIVYPICTVMLTVSVVILHVVFLLKVGLCNKWLNKKIWKINNSDL